MSDRVRPPEDRIAAVFRAKAEWHRLQARAPLREKVRILLELQRQDYPLLKRHRRLEWWEEPWTIEPQILTNLRVVRDEESSTGWTLTHDLFLGWETVPAR